MASSDFSLIFVWEKLYHAVLALVGPADLKTRFQIAFPQVTSFDVKEDVGFVPAEIQGEFEKFFVDSQSADLNTMGEEEMLARSEQIINMFDLIARHHGPYSIS